MSSGKQASSLLAMVLVLAGVSGSAHADGVTILFDAFGRDRVGMKRSWGFAALVEAKGQRILFDAGGDAQIFQDNVRALNIDLRKLDLVVSSHAHDDHVAGLVHVRALSPSALFFAPDDPAYGGPGANHAPHWLKNTAAPDLPADSRYYRGDQKHPISVERRFSKLGARIVERHRQVAPGVHLVATVSERFGSYRPQNGDPQKRVHSGLRELTLVLETKRGLAVIVGCSHAGIDEILRAVKAAVPGRPIAMLVGGFHLVEDLPASVEATAIRLRDQHKVNLIAPGHCSSEAGFRAMRKLFGPRFRYAGLGDHIAIAR